MLAAVETYGEKVLIQMGSSFFQYSDLTVAETQAHAVRFRHFTY
jgi:hypothetical protein